jgi:hypothetical protein
VPPLSFAEIEPGESDVGKQTGRIFPGYRLAAHVRAPRPDPEKRGKLAAS